MAGPAGMRALVPFSQTSTPPARVYLASLAESGRASMTSALKTVAEIVAPGIAWEFFPWHQIRSEHIAAINVQLIKRYQPRSTNKILAAVRGVLKACWRMKLIETDDYQRTIDSVRGQRVNNHVSTGRALSEPELEKLVAAGDAQEAAIVVAMARGGLRRVEITTVSRDAYDLRDGALKIKRKGGKIGIVYLAPGWKEVMDQWWTQAPGVDKNNVNRPLFHNQHGKPLNILAVSRLIDKIAERAGIRFTPHDLRRTFATDLLAAGADLETVRDLMGHESIQTTAIYDRRGEDSKRKAVAMIGRGLKRGR